MTIGRIGLGQVPDISSLKATKALVSVSRGSIEPEPSPSIGYIVEWSDELLVLQRMSDRFDLDGYEAILRRHVTTIDTEFHRSPLLNTVAKAKALNAVDLASIVTTDMQSLLTTVQANYPLLVIEREILYPEEGEVGTVGIFSAGSFRLRLVNSEGEWIDEPIWCKVSDVTRVLWDGDYENGLALAVRMSESG